MRLELVPQGVCLFLRVILLISKPSSAILVPLVTILYVFRCELILVIFERTVFVRSSIVCVEIEIGTVRGESGHLGMAGGVKCPDEGKGLVPGVDKCCSVIAAL